MMDVEIPSANVRDAHVMSAQFRRLNLPQDVGAGGVLVANLDRRCRHSINALPAWTSRYDDKW